MSGHVVESSNSDKDMEPLQINRESCPPYQLRWMAHWIPSCSNSSQGYRNNVISEANNADHEENQGCLQVESMEPREAKLLGIDMKSRNVIESNTTRKANTEELNVALEVPRSAKAIGTEHEKINIINYSKSVSSKLSIQRALKDFTTCNLMKSENLSSEMDHFPLFDINRKIGSILDPAKKSSYGIMPEGMYDPHFPSNESTFAFRFIKNSSQDHCFEGQSMSKSTEQRMRPNECFRGTYQDDLARYSRSKFHEFKCDRSSAKSCTCAREENNPLSSYGEQLATVRFTRQDRSTFMVSEMENNAEMTATSFGRSLSRLKDNSMQVLRDFPLCDIHFPFLSGEAGRGVQNASGIEQLPLHKSHYRSIKVNRFDYSHLSRKMSKSSVHDAEALHVDISQKVKKSWHNLTKFNSIEASPIREDILKDTKFWSSRGLSGSRTESTDAYRDVENSKSHLKSSAILDSNNRWGKRHSHNHLDTPPPTKRFKIKDAPYSSKVQNLLERAVASEGPSPNLSHHREGQEEFENARLQTRNGVCSSRDVKATHNWIRRWCRRSQGLSTHTRKRTSTVLCESETLKWCTSRRAASKPILEIPLLHKRGDGYDMKVDEAFVGKHFPSIKAMALVGKAVKKFCPCKYRVKGSCMVWNVQGF